MQELLAIMARLRAADGCPWDREQTFSSIAPYTIEEAYEVADAVEQGDMAHLKDELGDLLLQVVFHSQIASELKAFDFAAVTSAICEKLLRRHPHVFQKAEALSVAQQSAAWEDLKAQERFQAAGAQAPAQSSLDGVPRALPALMRAYKLSKRAARVGFDFDHSAQTADKVAEELAEVRDAVQGGASAHIAEEVGDLLFAAANLARKLDVDAEAALRAANAKFERRFRGMEALALERGQDFSKMNLEAQEKLWHEVKRRE